MLIVTMGYLLLVILLFLHLLMIELDSSLGKKFGRWKKGTSVKLSFLLEAYTLPVAIPVLLLTPLPGS